MLSSVNTVEITRNEADLTVTQVPEIATTQTDTNSDVLAYT